MSQHVLMSTPAIIIAWLLTWQDLDTSR